MARNQATLFGVNGVASVRLATESDFLRLPGFGRVAYPNEPAPSTEVITAEGVGATTGHARLGTFEVELPALLPHHPSVEKVRAARASQAVVHFQHVLPARALGSLTIPAVAANADPFQFTPAAAQQAAAQALVAMGIVFKEGAVVYTVVDFTQAANGDLSDVVLAPIVGAQAQIQAGEKAFSMPQLTRSPVVGTIQAFNEGEVEAEGTMRGSITFQLTSALPKWTPAVP